MRQHYQIFLVVLIVGASSLQCISQPATKSVPSKAPELKLRILPNKETYVLNEKVFTRTEFTNLTDKTLCFPEPVQGPQVPASGYLITEGDAPDAQDRERFIEVFDGVGTWPRPKLLSEIEKNWIKVGPNAVYVTTLADAKLELQARGQWRLRTTYHPPECSFNVQTCNQFMRSTANSVGCTIPETPVSAEPVPINVVPAPEEK